MAGNYRMSRFAKSSALAFFSVVLLAVTTAESQEQPPAEGTEKIEPQAPDQQAPVPAPDSTPLSQESSAPVPAPTVAPAQETAPPVQYVDIRGFPERLRPIPGQLPPEPYVEGEEIRRGLVIAGAAVFGGSYAAAISISMQLEYRSLLIPIAGPLIMGLEEASAHSASNQVTLIVGILGSVVQTTGVVLFIAGMNSKKKTWLRQDLAGISFQFSPTLLAERQPGLGISGTF